MTENSAKTKVRDKAGAEHNIDHLCVIFFFKKKKENEKDTPEAHHTILVTRGGGHCLKLHSSIAKSDRLLHQAWAISKIGLSSRSRNTRAVRKYQVILTRYSHLVFVSPLL